MKIRLTLATLICALVASPALRAENAGKEETTELGSHMEKAGGAWRAIKRQITDATKNEDTLKRLGVVKTELTASLKLKPEKTADKPEADRAKFVAAYADGIKAQIALIEKLEAAVKAGKNDEAAKLCAEADQAQKDGHKEFKKQKPKKQ